MGDRRRIGLEDKRKRYEIACPYCGKIQYACKSIAHELGILNAGHGTCLNCKKLMRLILDEESQSMRAKVWEIEDQRKKPEVGL